MSDLAKLTAQPKPFVAGGVTYQVYPLTIGELGKLQAWIDAQYLDPIALALSHCDGLPVQKQKFLMEMAIAQASKPKPRLGSPEAAELLNSIGGLTETLYLGIAKGDPSFTREMAAKVVAELTPDTLGSVQEQTEIAAVMPDPKAPTTGEAPG